MNIGRVATPKSIVGNMFCTSLRQRKEWDSVPQTLLTLQSNPGPKWREMTLTTHDLALPLPPGSADARPRKAIFLLLSTSDLKHEATLQRIERFSLTGDEHQAIIFLLHEKEDGRDGMAKFIEFQSTLMTLDIAVSILPLQNVKSLPAIVSTFHRSILSRRTPSIPHPSPQKQIDLLRTCSAKGKLKDHTVNVISELTHGLRELSEWAVADEGAQVMGEYMQDQQALSNVVGFWREEYIAE